MGAKSRGNFLVAICLRRCINRDKRCEDCIAYSKYIPIGGADSGAEGVVDAKESTWQDRTIDAEERERKGSTGSGR